MNLHPGVYIIFYGSWPAASQAIILTFVTGLGSTTHWKINKAYSGVGPLIFKKSIVDPYSQGVILNNPYAAINNAFVKGLLPQDVNGIYLVISSRYDE